MIRNIIVLICVAIMSKVVIIFVFGAIAGIAMWLWCNVSFIKITLQLVFMFVAGGMFWLRLKRL